MRGERIMITDKLVTENTYLEHWSSADCGEAQSKGVKL